MDIGGLQLSNRAKYALERLTNHPRGMRFDATETSAELFFDVLTCDQLLRLKGCGSHTLNEIRRVLRDAHLKMKCGCPAPHANARHAAHATPEDAVLTAAQNLSAASRKLAAAARAAKDAEDALARARATYDAAFKAAKVAVGDLGAGG